MRVVYLVAVLAFLQEQVAFAGSGSSKSTGSDSSKSPGFDSSSSDDSPASLRLHVFVENEGFLFHERQEAAKVASSSSSPVVVSLFPP